jgi:hypothetical protein
MRCPHCNHEIRVASSLLSAAKGSDARNKLLVALGAAAAVIFILIRLAAITHGFRLSPVVTQAEYERIQTGMTYRQVADIVGEPGVELSRSGMAGNIAVVYFWSNPNGSVLDAVFSNDRLVSKAQSRLP